MERESDGCRERRSCFERLAMPCDSCWAQSVIDRHTLVFVWSVFSGGAGDDEVPERCW